MIVDQLTMTQWEQGLTRTRVAILPIGSVEEHGSHLPLGTDTAQVWETCRRAAERIPVFLCPALPYGYCRSTRDHPGTLSISAASLRSMVYDIACSLHRQGIRGLILASGHAGGIHMAALEEIGEILLADLDPFDVAVVCEYHWAQEAGRSGLVETADDGHAGEIETSRILALDPDRVAGRSPEEYPLSPKPFLCRDKRKHWPGGVWGNPAAASPETGRRLFAASAERMIALVREMALRVEANSPLGTGSS